MRPTAARTSATAGNIDAHHNYGHWGVPFYRVTQYQGGSTASCFNVDNAIQDAQGDLPP